MDTNDLFQEFSAAAKTPETRLDILDDIEAWAKGAHGHISAIRNAICSIAKQSDSFFGLNISKYSLPQSEVADDFARKTWDCAIGLFERDFVKPKQVTLPCDTETFVKRALGVDRSESWRWHRNNEGDENLENRLLLWDAAKIRSYFDSIFGDVRDVAVKQLRERVIASMGECRRPEPKTNFYCRLFERKYGSSVLMTRIYQSSREDHFGDLVRYIVYLATGEVPGKEEMPRFYGYDDTQREFDRATLFKKQFKPFAGAQWLRFCADGYVDIAFEPAVLARLQVQWDEKFSKLEAVA